MIGRAVCMALLLVASNFARSQVPAADPTMWLNRMATAAQTLNYSGTFVFQSGVRSETSLIVHAVYGDRELERLEVLDGSPREVVRDRNEVRCYLPDDRRVVVDKRRPDRDFPALIKPNAKLLADHYTVREGETERVAGHEVRLIVLEPKDGWRYGHRLWAEVSSGLIVKAQTLDERSHPIEQFSFTQLSIGAPISREQLNARHAAGDWKVEKLPVSEVADGRWRARSLLPGFFKTQEMRRRWRDGGPPIEHLVFSDGLAAVSVFIEPLDRDHPHAAGAAVQGALNLFVRPIAGYTISVLGEVPPATVRNIAYEIESYKP
jgi:sigma-E factor negative regulatory protein RseB